MRRYKEEGRVVPGMSVAWSKQAKRSQVRGPLFSQVSTTECRAVEDVCRVTTVLKAEWTHVGSAMGNRGGVGVTGPWAGRRAGAPGARGVGSARGSLGAGSKKGGPVQALRARVPEGCWVAKRKNHPEWRQEEGQRGRGDQAVSAQGRGGDLRLGEEHRLCARKVT